MYVQILIHIFKLSFRSIKFVFQMPEKENIYSSPTHLPTLGIIVFYICQYDKEKIVLHHCLDLYFFDFYEGQTSSCINISHLYWCVCVFALLDLAFCSYFYCSRRMFLNIYYKMFSFLTLTHISKFDIEGQKPGSLFPEETKNANIHLHSKIASHSHLIAAMYFLRIIEF